MTRGKGPSGSSVRTFWGRVSPRTGTLLWAAITVVFLGLLIFAIAAVSSPKDSSPVSQLTPAEQGNKYYDEAVTQEAQGNLDQALGLAEKAVKADPSNARAKALVAKLKVAKQRASGNGSSSQSSNPTSPSLPATSAVVATATPDPNAGVDPVFLKPADDITVFLPAQIDGWVLATPVGVGADGTVGAEPAASNTSMRPVSRVLLAVHDRGTSAKARAFVDGTIKRAYPKDGASVVILGAPGYFGTDGTRLAAVGFARGRYAFEIILTIPTGQPGTFKSAAEGLAAAFPTTLGSE